MPGMSIADHLRVAVQAGSRSVARKTVYTHTGWRQIGGRHVYLSASGALDELVTVDLGPLSGYSLPDVRDVRGSLAEAVSTSLGLLDIAPDAVTVPVIAAAYRAALPLPPDCSVWLRAHRQLQDGADRARAAALRRLDARLPAARKLDQHRQRPGDAGAHGGERPVRR